MRLQKDVEYGLISLTALGEGQRLMSAAELSRLYGIPRSLLAKILQQLQKAGLIEAERGNRGGYRLRRPLETVTVQEVIDALKGGRRLVPCLEGGPCELIETCSIRRGVASLQGLFEELLSSLTLAELSDLAKNRGRREHSAGRLGRRALGVVVEAGA